eukprot:7852868-Karenia_brevis.AAC.1
MASAAINVEDARRVRGDQLGLALCDVMERCTEVELTPNFVPDQQTTLLDVWCALLRETRLPSAEECPGQ